MYENDELIHYGVKGMKWGVRTRKELKVAKKFAKVGKKQGQADYYNQQGDLVKKKHEANAKVFDKIAKQQEAKGSYVKAELARKSAAALRARGENASNKKYEIADMYVKRATKLNEKATKFATKKRVDLGKSKIQSIMKESSTKGFEAARSVDTAAKNKQVRDAIGDRGLEAYNKIRGV